MGGLWPALFIDGQKIAGVDHARQRGGDLILAFTLARAWAASGDPAEDGGELSGQGNRRRKSRRPRTTSRQRRHGRRGQDHGALASRSIR
jgi:hypothetical protein